MTPTPVAPPQAPQASSLPTWWDVAKSIPESAPDTVYDGAREGFFQQHVMPWALQNGQNSELVRKNFMDQTQRPGQTSMPRTAVVAKEALSSLMAPVLGLYGDDIDKSSLEASAQASVDLARRQGIWTPPYQFAGSVLGQAPYFALGEAAIGGGLGLLGSPLKEAARAISVGVIQGAYDAAANTDGERLKAFGKGALTGTALGTGFEMLHGIMGISRAAHDLTILQAEGVQAAAQGIATPAQENAATAAVVNSTGLSDTVQQAVAQSIQSANKLGVPKDITVDVAPTSLTSPTPASVTKTPRIKINMIGADGKPYTLGGGKGLPVDATLDKTIEMISNHLSNGAQIVDLGGSKKGIQTFLNQVETKNLSEDFQLPIKPIADGVKPSKPATTPVPLTDAPRFQPPQGVQDWLNSHPTADDYALKQKFQFGDLALKKVRDWWDDQQYGAAPRASFASDNFHAESGTWIAPDGTVHDIGLYVHAQRIPDASVAKGWIRTRGDAITVDSVENPGLAKVLLEGQRDVYLNTPNGLGLQIPKEDIGDFLANPAKYAKQNADDLPRFGNKRFAVNPSDVPKYDEYLQLPNNEIVRKPTGEIFDSMASVQTAKLQALMGDDTPPLRWTEPETPKAYGRVRGSSDIPLSLNGIQQIKTLGENIRNKGSLDELHSADLTRHKQTAGLIASSNPLTVLHPPDPQLRSWALGGLEGEEHTPRISRAINSYVDNPTEAPGGIGTNSTSMGESFGDFANRIIGNVNDKLQQVAQDPSRKIGLVTSSRDVGVIKSWLGADGDINKFSDIMKRSHENPGSIYHVGLQDDGGVGIRQIDPESQSQLQGGVYLIRHGETPWNQSAREAVTMKNTPLGMRSQGPHPLLQGAGDSSTSAKGLTIGSARFYEDTLDRGTIAHERYHALTNALDMHGAVMNIMDHPTTTDIYNKGFDPAVRESYGSDPYIWREEVYAHSLDAIRTNNTPKIHEFIEADTDAPTFFQWFRDKTQDQLDVASGRPDSIYKRAYERSLNDANNRATRYLEDVNNVYSQAEHQLGLNEGDYALYNAENKSITSYPNRELALRDLETEQQPLNAPELVGMDRLPSDVPRFARRIRTPDGKRPILTDPPDPAIGERVPARAGFSLFSHFLRPFHAWVGTVASKNDWPELYGVFQDIDHSQVEYNNFTRPYVAELKDTLAKASPERQKDFYTWFQTQPSRRAGVEDKLLFTDEELGMLQRVKDNILDPLANEFGTSLEHYVRETIPRINSAGDVWKGFPDAKADSFMVRKVKTGQLDPNDENLLRVTGKYLEYGSRAKFTEPALDAAEAEINSRIPTPGATDIGDLNLTTPRAGALRPILQRQLDNLRGRPDYTNLIVKGAIQDATDAVNRGITAVNSKLPKSMQIPTIDEISDDPLGKFTLFQYAGTLGLKPATLIRDSLQYFITTYPIAGNYAWKGMAKVFPALKIGSDEAKRLWQVAQDYGALIERNDLSSLYNAADGDALHVGEHNIENFAKWTLGAIQFSHNSNRLAAFWGHSEQVADALEAFGKNQDLGQFNRKSGLWFLDKPLREQFNHEMQTMDATPSVAQDFAHRAAAKLVEASQWNLRRGANPGLYNYSLGRLFGQYGTWPLNYIEYARRFAAAEDRGASMHAMTRLVLSHGAILAAGQAAGIDSGRWVFTQPAADWQGGPMFQMLLNAPKTLDFNTSEGEDARKEIRKEFFPSMIPGGDEAERIYTAITTEDPDFWKKVLGFHVLQSADYDRGLHSLLPQ